MVGYNEGVIPNEQQLNSMAFKNEACDVDARRFSRNAREPAEVEHG